MRPIGSTMEADMNVARAEMRCWNPIVVDAYEPQMEVVLDLWLSLCEAWMIAGAKQRTRSVGQHYEMWVVVLRDTMVVGRVAAQTWLPMEVVD